MTKLAIIGGTGRTGQQVISQALSKGYELNVLARDPNKVAPHPKITVIQGDAKDTNALDRLLEGTIAVISTLGPSGINESIKKAKQSAVEFTSTKSTTAILPFLKKHNINRFILMGGASLVHPEDSNSWFVNLLFVKIALKVLGDMTLDRQQELGLLLKSDLNFTIVRAGKLLDEPSSKPLKLSSTRFQGIDISIPDIARFMVEQVQDQSFARKAVYLSN